MQEVRRYSTENQRVKHSRLKWAGAILGGFTLPLAILYPAVGDKAVEACQSGYAEMPTTDDNLFDDWGRNIAVNFCDAEIPEPTPLAPPSDSPFTMNV